jgi:hypothetical protein
MFTNYIHVGTFGRQFVVKSDIWYISDCQGYGDGV